MRKIFLFLILAAAISNSVYASGVDFKTGEVESGFCSGGEFYAGQIEAQFGHGGDIQPGEMAFEFGCPSTQC